MITKVLILALCLLVLAQTVDAEGVFEHSMTYDQTSGQLTITLVNHDKVKISGNGTLYYDPNSKVEKFEYDLAPDGGKKVFKFQPPRTGVAYLDLKVSWSNMPGFFGYSDQVLISSVPPEKIPGAPSFEAPLGISSLIVIVGLRRKVHI